MRRRLAIDRAPRFDYSGPWWIRQRIFCACAALLPEECLIMKRARLNVHERLMRLGASFRPHEEIKRDSEKKVYPGIVK
jgi:hypothetical protein